jgi:hypothetical protein
LRPAFETFDAVHIGEEWPEHWNQGFSMDETGEEIRVGPAPDTGFQVEVVDVPELEFSSELAIGQELEIAAGEYDVVVELDGDSAGIPQEMCPIVELSCGGEFERVLGPGQSGCPSRAIDGPTTVQATFATPDSLGCDTPTMRLLFWMVIDGTADQLVTYRQMTVAARPL